MTLDDTKATDSTTIRNDENYRIFVLAVSNTGNSSMCFTAYADVKLSVTSAVGVVTITNVEVKKKSKSW